MTYTSKEVIRTLLENDGVYPGDPQMALVYSYRGLSSEPLYAVFADERHDDVHSSPYVREPKLLWSRTEGLTEEGRLWLDS